MENITNEEKIAKLEAHIEELTNMQDRIIGLLWNIFYHNDNLFNNEGKEMIFELIHLSSIRREKGE